jgi:hypothetical protein
MNVVQLQQWSDQFIMPGVRTLYELTGVTTNRDAHRLMLTIALQESACRYRAQVLNSGRAGPARGWWQFEKNGGVAQILESERTKEHALALCRYLIVRPEREAVWRALEGCDELAVGFARLLLWQDLARLPGVDQVDAAWRYYLRNWRPGKPKPTKWGGYWNLAKEVVDGVK